VDYADIESSEDEDTMYDRSTREGRVVEDGPMFDRVGNSLRRTIEDIEGFPRRNVNETTLNTFLEPSWMQDFGAKGHARRQPHLSRRWHFYALRCNLSRTELVP